MTHLERLGGTCVLCGERVSVGAGREIVLVQERLCGLVHDVPALLCRRAWEQASRAHQHAMLVERGVDPCERERLDAIQRFA